MIAGSSLRNACIFLGCIALLLFGTDIAFDQSFGLPLLYKFREPVDLQAGDGAGKSTSQPTNDTTKDASHPRHDIALVVASQLTDNTAWLEDGFNEWDRFVYITNDPYAHLTVPANKGREGQVYLTYIIDNYDRLHEINIFHHAERYQWHTDDPFFDGQRLLSRIRPSYIREKGYTNLRCNWALTCPSSVRPHDDAWTAEKQADPDVEGPNSASFYKEAFETLFPGEIVPEDVGAPCCAEFAATADRIRQRPKSDYVRIRDWLTETSLDDDISGRIMEYSWHIIFGEPAVSCPIAAECYCSLYEGLCNLECEEDGQCDEQYVVPEFAGMPEGWPETDWNGEWRNATQMRIDYDAKHPIAAGS